MSTSITIKQIVEIIKEVKDYKKNLDKLIPDKKNGHLKTYKEFLVDNKVDSSINNLLNREIEFKIDLIVVESKNIILDNKLLLEWEQYKGIPKTNLIYRYDKGNGMPGFEDHIHVFLGNTKNQVYAINKSGSPHDNSSSKLSNKEIKFLKGIGFTPPASGILEWYNLDPNKNYFEYRRHLLFD